MVMTAITIGILSTITNLTITTEIPMQQIGAGNHLEVDSQNMRKKILMQSAMILITGLKQYTTSDICLILYLLFYPGSSFLSQQLDLIGLWILNGTIGGLKEIFG